MPRRRGRSIKSTNRFSYLNLLWLALMFGAIGAYFIIRSFAAPNPNLPGDLNGDNVVNSSDLSIMTANYGTTNAVADINADGHVTVVDLSLLISHYGQTYSGSSSSGSSSSSSSSGSGGASDIASESSCPNQTNTGASAAAQETAMICMTNYARNVDGGLVALASNTPLYDAAVAKNNDIVTCNDFSHTACGRASFDYWIHYYGYAGDCWGENIAYGYTTVHDTFVAWMNSSGHRANILDSDYRDIGQATTTWGSNGPLWTTDFGGC